MTTGKEMDGEEERGGFCSYNGQAPSNMKVVSLGSSSNGYQVSLGGSNPKKACFSKIGRHDESLLIELQDADYSQFSLLPDELELMIFARIPITEYGKVGLLNKKYLSLLKNADLFKERRELGVMDFFVFVLATGDKNWWAFDRQFLSWRRLPGLPADPCFLASDKETLCAGTHLVVSGREANGSAIWRYEWAMNKWFPGPSMNHPRCLFASATCGGYAFVAGGIGIGSNKRVLSSVEKYDPQSKIWKPLPDMIKKRKLCSGIYMHNKFYVLGGQNEHGKSLTCGEVFNEYKNTWVEIPDILKDSPVATSESPPLVAVVNNHLYSIETSSNQLKVYLKETNSWKKLGPVPVITDFNRGWGVAFKSLGDELLVMGGVALGYAGHGLAVYTCCPDPNARDLNWKLLNGAQNWLSHFILNCSVMAA